MTFVNDIRHFEADVLSRVGSAARSFGEGFEKRRQFKNTVRELSALEDRDLDDLGVNRCDIREIAYRSIFEK